MSLGFRSIKESEISIWSIETSFEVMFDFKFQMRSKRFVSNIIIEYMGSGYQWYQYRLLFSCKLFRALNIPTFDIESGQSSEWTIHIFIIYIYIYIDIYYIYIGRDYSHKSKGKQNMEWSDRWKSCEQLIDGLYFWKIANFLYFQLT